MAREANAVTLGISPYSEFSDVGEVTALKLFTQRVEDHRNDQRRRQQQLDQPADQAPPAAGPQAPWSGARPGADRWSGRFGQPVRPMWMTTMVTVVSVISYRTR
ncbi:hypothetical protein [Streptomyces sp. OE57]|uniref:hypothetical protein n=1 Tax=Streptomyces lacaronensis TaxID=3379885 RepID=UPI0039B7710E